MRHALADARLTFNLAAAAAAAGLHSRFIITKTGSLDAGISCSSPWKSIYPAHDDDVGGDKGQQDTFRPLRIFYIPASIDPRESSMNHARSCSLSKLARRTLMRSDKEKARRMSIVCSTSQIAQPAVCLSACASEPELMATFARAQHSSVRSAHLRACAVEN